MFLSGFAPFDEYNPDNDGSKYESFLSSLPLYYTTDYNQVFCHAGIDEKSGEYLEESTTDIDYTEKYPADVLQPNDNKLCVDVIAGHIGTAELYREYTGMRNCFEIFSDGSHYYIDGTTGDSETVPILRYNTETGEYAEVTNGMINPILPWWFDQ